MGNFKMPQFQYIVNEDFQAVLKADKVGVISNYAGGTDLDPTLATHLFKLEGEHDWFKATQLNLLSAALRVRKQVWATAVKQISTFVATAVTATKGDVFRIVVDGLDKTPTAYQNIPLEKRYQLSKDVVDGSPQAQVTTITMTGTTGTLALDLDGVNYSVAFNASIDQTTDDFRTTHAAALLLKDIVVTDTATEVVFTANTAGNPHNLPTDASTGDIVGAVVATTPNISGGEQSIVQNMAAVINADDNAAVVATYDDVTLTLTAKNFRESFNLYTSAIAGTFATGTPAVDWVNDYENLKTKQWVADLDFDRNAEYFPQKGAKYNSYLYEIISEQDTGGHTVPSQVAVQAKTQFMVFVKQGLTLDTALDAMATDMNV